MSTKRSLEDKHILVVDDEPDILDTLEELLSICHVDKALSYEEAEKKLDTNHYDIAILDIMGVRGYDLLEIATSKKITTVMLTANALSPEDTIKSHKKGAAYYLPKEELIHIEEHLNDVLQMQAQGKNTWGRWFGRFASFYERKFGSDWQEEDRTYWDKFKNYY